MLKQIKFTYSEKEYILQFNRKSIEKMESNGFDINDIQKKPVTTLPRLFHGAFLCNHPYIKKELTDEIYSKMTNKEQLLSKLAEMYSEPVVALMEEPEDGEGNVSWGASW